MKNTRSYQLAKRSRLSIKSCVCGVIGFLIIYSFIFSGESHKRTELELVGVAEAYPPPPTSTPSIPLTSIADRIHLPMVSSLAGTSGNFFAGYDYLTSSLGVKANISYFNPSVQGAINDFSTEWVMVNPSGSGYMQAGWLKFVSSAEPEGFVEYNDDPFDTSSGWLRLTYGVIPNSTQEYMVQRTTVSSVERWCGYIAGVQKLCVNASAIGFSTTGRILFCGETRDTRSQLGGTPSNRVRFTGLSFRRSSDGLWLQVNTTFLRDVLTPGLQYRIAKGFDSASGVTFIENWTQ